MWFFWFWLQKPRLGPYNWRMSEASSSTSPPLDDAQQHLKKISDSLHVLNEPDPPQSATLDIILFHGLQREQNSCAHLSTWRGGELLQDIWPQTWLPMDHPATRSITVSYDACIQTTSTRGKMDLHSLGENLLTEILLARRDLRSNRKTILVGQSFGGLVIKQLCVHACRNKENNSNADEISRFLDDIGGVFFYGTPHHGMDGILSKYSERNSLTANKSLLKLVQVSSPEAARLHDEFVRCRNVYGWKIYSVAETQATGGEDTVWVPEASSRFEDNYIHVAADHFSICRPSGRECLKYQHLDDLIRKVRGNDQDQGRQPQDVPTPAVGVHSLLREVETYLQEHPGLGFSGMGGIGKTTMAKLVFNNLHTDFEYTCFVENVKEIPGTKAEVKEKIWLEMHHNGKPVRMKEHIRPDVWRQVKGKKLLIVFDDIAENEHRDLLEVILKNNDCKESRFIVTTRDEEVLGPSKVCGMRIFRVPFLKHEDARTLFLAHAFPNSEEPPTDTHQRIVEEVVKACAGLPLTLAVVGRHLAAEKDVNYWAEIPAALWKAVDLPWLEKPVWKKLSLSYESLGKVERHMFLDIASFFVNPLVRFTVDEVLCAWIFIHDIPRIRFNILMKRYLVCGSSNDLTLSRRFKMHEHLRALGERNAKLLGRTLVVPSTPALIEEDFESILSQKEPDSLVALQVVLTPWEDPVNCCICKLIGFLQKKMAILYLQLKLGETMGCERCSASGDSFLPKGVAMLDVEGSNTNLELPVIAAECKKLIVLKITGMPVVRTMFIHSLRSGVFRNVQHLSLTSCSLEWLPDAFGELPQLRKLQLISFENLRKLPESLGGLTNLEHLVLSKCYRLTRLLPSVSPPLQRLEIDSDIYRRVWSDIIHGHQYSGTYGYDKEPVWLGADEECLSVTNDFHADDHCVDNFVIQGPYFDLIAYFRHCFPIVLKRPQKIYWDYNVILSREGDIDRNILHIVRSICKFSFYDATPIGYWFTPGSASVFCSLCGETARDCTCED
ncbi:hypothetical protein Mapa_013014 [Marchantia paleacea]|nr:hypothetical protein Mapa_013014 [Marchantia paleacea]